MHARTQPEILYFDFIHNKKKIPMKVGNIIIFVGGILLVLSIFLVFIASARGPYQDLGTPFIVISLGGFVLIFIGLRLRSYPKEVEKHARIKRERRELERVSLLQRARNLEEARNFEAAAGIYERLGMFKEAGRVREKSQVVKVTKTEVSVNLNSLLQQLRDGGIAVVYRCPHCGAPLKIGKDTNVESLEVCEHCGSEIETVDVADFLRTALS